MPRIVQILLIVLAAPLLIPVLAGITLAVLVALGRPAIFRQKRGGLGGVPFDIMKFRTMTDSRGADGELLPDDQRTPALGRFLRRTSLDELPALWNVLKGEMALVGPRPFIADYLPLYSSEQRRRHLVRPGITGWAQVNGRNAIEWERKFALDVEYVERRSFTFDLKILALTALKVMRGEGVDEDGGIGQAKFTGNK